MSTRPNRTKTLTSSTSTHTFRNPLICHVVSRPLPMDEVRPPRRCCVSLTDGNLISGPQREVHSFLYPLGFYVSHLHSSKTASLGSPLKMVVYQKYPHQDHAKRTGYRLSRRLTLTPTDGPDPRTLTTTEDGWSVLTVLLVSHTHCLEPLPYLTTTCSHSIL